MKFITLKQFLHLIVSRRLRGGRDGDSDEGGGGVFDGLADGHGVVYGRCADVMPNVNVSDGRVDVARHGPGDEVCHGGNHGALDVLLDLTGANVDLSVSNSDDGDAGVAVLLFEVPERGVLHHDGGDGGAHRHDHVASHSMVARVRRVLRLVYSASDSRLIGGYVTTLRWCQNGSDQEHEGIHLSFNISLYSTTSFFLLVTSLNPM